MSDVPSPIIITNPEKNIIKVYSRDKKGKRIIKTYDDFRPYFYYEDPNGRYRSIFGNRLEKEELVEPKGVYKAREAKKKNGTKVFEADILYTMRFAIDRAENWEKVPLRILFMDIEAENSLDFINAPRPIVSTTLYDTFDGKYYTFILGDTGMEGENWVVKCFDDEEGMLERIVYMISEKEPDIITAWNLPYDINYLISRIRRLSEEGTIDADIVNSLSPESRILCTKIKREKADTEGLWVVREIPGVALVDLLDLYCGRVRLRSYTLDDVAEHEGIMRKIKRPARIADMSPDELARYNKRDVEIMVTLDRRLSIFESEDELRRLAGLPWNLFYTFEAAYGRRVAGKYRGRLTSRIVESYILRKTKRLGIVLPSKEKGNETESYEGAFIYQPKPGVFKNVAVFDIKSMYPNIIRTYNLSPETYDPKNGDIRVPGKEHRYRSEPRGLLPMIEDELFALRQEYKKRMKQAKDEEERRIWDMKQQAVKVILNAVYGFTGQKGSRLYHVPTAESVTAFGRAIIRDFLSNVVREFPETGELEVIYGDSVSKDSKIVVKRGEKIFVATIEDLFFTARGRNIRTAAGREYKLVLGVETLTLDKNGQLVWRPIKYIMRHKVKKRMYRVWVDKNTYVDVTEDHSIIGVVERDSKVEFIKVRPTEIGKKTKHVVVLTGTMSAIDIKEVLSVEEITYDDYVYDIEVEDTHVFFANNILVHNTDSVFVRFPAKMEYGEIIELARKLEKFINDRFPDFARQWGAKVCYHEVEFQKLYDAILFVGKKKRYFGRYVWKEGTWEEGFDVKGFEIVRTDTAKITATVMTDVLKTLVTARDWREGIRRARNIIEEYREKIRRGEIPIEDLVFKSSIDPNKEYKSLTPAIRGLMNAKSLGLVELEYAGQVMWLYVKGLKQHDMLKADMSIDVIALPEEKKELFRNFEIDYQRCGSRWFDAAERVIETIMRAMGQTRLI